VYCGAYVFGRTTTEVFVKDGRKGTRNGPLINNFYKIIISVRLATHASRVTDREALGVDA
jgi:hypothetical protein